MNGDPIDFGRVKFERELASITNGAEFVSLTAPQLRQLIKLLFARQKEVGREDEEIQEILFEFRTSSSEAECIFDEYDDKLNY